MHRKALSEHQPYSVYLFFSVFQFNWNTPEVDELKLCFIRYFLVQEYYEIVNSIFI